MLFDVDGFKAYCINRGWIFDSYSSEFTFQFRICQFLDHISKQKYIELESNIERYDIKNKIKKEIDIDVLDENSKKIAIEIKFIRDQGSFNIGMFDYCKDIKFLEELVDEKFDKGIAIIFTTIKELYTPPNKIQRPKNIENLVLYNSFRVDKVLAGNLRIKTGSKDESLKLKGSYPLNWMDFNDSIKICLVYV